MRVLPQEKAVESSELLAFLIESNAAAKLSHQNIAVSARPEQVDNFHYCVSQYPDGAKTLRDILDRNGWFEVSRALGIVIQVAQALRYAHSTDVLHLSLQPDKVWIDGDDSVTLTGFGVPRTPERDWIQKRRSQDGIPAYRSPEQLADERVDERSDLYSLGVVFYEMLTDMLPYQAADAHQLQQKIVLQKALPIALIRPEVPAAIAAVVSRLIASDPAERFSCAADLQAELEQILDGRRESSKQGDPKTTSSAPAPAASAQVAMEGEEDEPLSFIFNDLDKAQGQSGVPVADWHEVTPVATQQEVTPAYAAPKETVPIETVPIEAAPNEAAKALTAEVQPKVPADGDWEPSRDEVWPPPVAPTDLSMTAYAGESLAPMARPLPLRHTPVLRYVMIAFLIGYSIGMVVLVYNGQLTRWFDRPTSPEQTSADNKAIPAMETQLLPTSEAATPADSEPAPAASEEAAVIPPRTESPAAKLRQQQRQQQATAGKRKARRTVTKAGRTKTQRPGRRLKFWN